MDYDDDDSQEAYDPDMYEEYGEGFETDFDSMSEKAYNKAFDAAQAEVKALAPEVETDETDFEFDEVVGGRDKKPVMSLLNKGKLSKYEMDDLLNEL